MYYFKRGYSFLECVHVLSRDTEMASVIINAILMFVEKYFYGLAVVVAARYRPFGRVFCGRGGKTLHPTVDSSASRCRQK